MFLVNSNFFFVYEKYKWIRFLHLEDECPFFTAKRIVPVFIIYINVKNGISSNRKKTATDAVMFMLSVTKCRQKKH